MFMVDMMTFAWTRLFAYHRVRHVLHVTLPYHTMSPESSQVSGLKSLNNDMEFEGLSGCCLEGERAGGGSSIHTTEGWLDG